MNTSRLVTAMLFALAVTATAQAAKSVPLAKNLALDKAKAALRAQGWKPRAFARFIPGDAMDIFHANGYTETEQCSNEEYSCVLDYADAHGACLRVMVSYSTLKPLHAWVDHWTSECPNPEMLKAPGAATH
ncbi:MAG: hypothetical protein ACM3ZT_09415 [Bacillota bacterium]